MDERRLILERVASGELTPEQAADLLTPSSQEDHSDDSEIYAEASEAGSSEAVFPDAEVDTLRVTGAFRSANIIADPTVKTATVDGAHSARIDGSVLVIDGDDEIIEGFRFESGKGRRRRTVHIGVDNPRPVPLTIRANPNLRLEAVMAAGTLKILGMHGAIKAEVSAGTLNLEDVTGPLDLTTAAGPIKVRGRISEGDHRIRCEAGAVKMVLEEGSDVRITARASLGKVILPGDSAPGGFSVGNASAESTIGRGTANLSIECALGAVKVAHAGDEGADEPIVRSTATIKRHMGWR